MYAGPVADLMAGITAIAMVARELRKPAYKQPLS